MPDGNNDAADRGLFAIPAGLALILVLLGAMVLAIGRHQSARAASMQSWPSTLGTVTGSGLVNVRQPSDTTGWIQRVDTSVRWTVNGRSYDVTFSDYAGRGTQGHEHLVRYHAGDPLRVFYDPAAPSQGSLTNKQTSPHVPFVLIGAACLVLSLPFWYLSARMLAKQRRRPSG